MKKIIEIYKKRGKEETFYIKDKVIFKKSRIYIFEGIIEDKAIKKIAEKLLTDPVIEEFSVGIKKSAVGTDILVLFKDNVLDIEGERVLKMLKFLNIKRVKKVRFGRKYNISKKLNNKEEIIKLLSRTLYNPVIEKIEFL